MSGFGFYFVVITGFVLALPTAATGCGGTVTGSQGSFTSPNYPWPYHYSATCVWNIRVPTGFHIEFNVEDFRHDARENCAQFLFEVFGGEDDSAPQIVRLCGQRGMFDSILITTNTIMVRYRTDGSLADAGFSVSYKAITE